MSFLDQNKFTIKVLKTEKFYENIGNNTNNIVKFILSDDEIDYFQTVDNIYNLQFLLPITKTNNVKNEISYDNNSNAEIILNINSIVFNITNDIQKTTTINPTLINGTERFGYIIENPYTDFIHIINTGNIYGDTGTIITEKYLNSKYEVETKPTLYQTIGTSFQVIVCNNINVDETIFELNVYSLTYPVSTKLYVKIEQ